MGHKMTAPLHNAKIGLMLPALLNPATATAAVVGIGLGLLWLLRDDEQETTVDAAPVKGAKPTARADAQRAPAVEVLPDKIVPEAPEAIPAGTLEAAQKEMIRTAMSELGKRSAAARAIKKAERE
ncbi:MAG: hypothetical protein ACI84R_003527 [Candidatus Azotimanducaceae bacterium]|jgi:hypothetical protein